MVSTVLALATDGGSGLTDTDLRREVEEEVGAGGSPAEVREVLDQFQASLDSLLWLVGEIARHPQGAQELTNLGVVAVLTRLSWWAPLDAALELPGEGPHLRPADAAELAARIAAQRCAALRIVLRLQKNAPRDQVLARRVLALLRTRRAALRSTLLLTRPTAGQRVVAVALLSVLHAAQRSLGSSAMASDLHDLGTVFSQLRHTLRAHE